MRLAPLAVGSIALLAACVARADDGRRETIALDGARAIVDWPARVDGRPTTLVVYACPNGNTAEQTLGGRAGPGVDWHYDIQHVLAQVRVVRERDPARNVVLAVVEADGKSWPAWRGKRGDAGNRAIRAIVERLATATNASDLTLMGHSGGGSFLFGYLEGGDAIPSSVSRVAWLDADYAFDGDKHGPKLAAWLDGDPHRNLIVVAYDDRRIELNGKPVLSSPEKGTYGATERLTQWLDAHGRPMTHATRDAFDSATDRAGQVRVAVRSNPENAIWHTRLVGDLNGVVYALRAGIEPDVWLAEPRAYTQVIGDPILRPATSPTTATAPTTTASIGTLNIPQRPADAPSGRTVMAAVANLSTADREARLCREILAGNVPTFLRTLRRVDVSGGGLRGAVWVTPDYLAVGSDDDWVRVPLTPGAAQAIATAFGGSLPTRKLVDDIWRAADVKLDPLPLVPRGEKGVDALPEPQRTDGRETARAFLQHHDLIEAQRQGTLGALVAGVKKDVVLSNRLNERPARIAIYGWHRPDGTPIQPLTIVHGGGYVDYSHGVRLVARTMRVAEAPADLADVLRDPARAALVSDEGPVTGGYGG